MFSQTTSAPLRTPELVIALHCSGAGAAQWRRLAEALGSNYELIAPEHDGCESVGPWTGEHAFTLADEAKRTIALIDSAERKVHLIGHSYGGGVALHVALARPERIASLALYEPSAFHLLRQFGPRAAAAFAEIRGIADLTGAGVVIGDYRGAAVTFVDYWSGPGAWDALRPAVRDGLTRWTSKAPLDFAALIDEPTPVSAYARLDCPVLIIRGEHAPAPTRLIAEMLPSMLPAAHLAMIAGAGHMGPLTHAAEVNVLIARHIAAIGSRCALALGDRAAAWTQRGRHSVALVRRRNSSSNVVLRLKQRETTMGRFLAFLYGLAAYVIFLGAFLWAVGFVSGLPVPKTIDTGAIVPLQEALVINVLLMSLFAIQHSVMARQGFKRRWTRLVPPAIERSTYVLFASLALALLLWQWRPIPTVVWQVTDPAVVTALTGVSLFGWLIVLTSTFLINHFELFGLHQVVNNLAGRQMAEPRFKTPVFYKLVRHPIYLGFIIAFWAAPTMTFGHLLFAAVTTAYIFVGITLEERDMIALFGDEYRRYRQQVGMLMPFRRG